MSVLIPCFNKTSNKTSNKTRSVGVVLILLIMTIISCPNADSGSSSGGGSGDSGPLVVSEVQLIAGGETAGTNNGQGAAASFNKPVGMAVDTDGTIYVADNNNHSIRKITPDGTVSTYAGNLGTKGTRAKTTNANKALTEARFLYPNDVVIKDADTMYVVDDSGFHEINRNTSKVNTVAGSAEADFGGKSLGELGDNTLRSLVYQGSTLYLVDPVDNENTSSNGQLFEYKNGAFTLIMDSGTFNTKISNIGTGNTSLVTLDTFHDVAFDSDENMYMIAGVSSRIFKFNPDNRIAVGQTGAGQVASVELLAGAIDTSTGTANGVGTAARFNRPGGILIQGDYMYVADIVNHVIRVVQISTKTVSTWVGIMGTAGHTNGTKDVATFNFLKDIAFAPNGDILVSDNHAIRRIVVQK